MQDENEGVLIDDREAFAAGSVDYLKKENTMTRIQESLLLTFFIVAIGTTPMLAQNEPGEWRFLGLRGRIVQQLRLHDHDLYVTTDNGLYRKDLRTTDTLWTPIGLQGRQTRTLLIFDADTLLASTQFDTLSLYRTTDAGATWLPHQNGFGGAFSETVMAIERHPDLPNVLFATGATVVAKSTDRGESWQISHGSWQGLATGVNFVKIDTNDSKIIWAGGQNSIERAFLKAAYMNSSLIWRLRSMPIPPSCRRSSWSKIIPIRTSVSLPMRKRSFHSHYLQQNWQR